MFGNEIWVYEIYTAYKTKHITTISPVADPFLIVGASLATRCCYDIAAADASSEALWEARNVSLEDIMKKIYRFRIIK